MNDDLRKQKAMVIDDDRMTADTLAQILRIHGFDVTAVYSGEQALESLATVQPDVVLSDIVMRRINGIETAIAIRCLHPKVRVILFTASAITPLLRERIDAFGFELLQRPLHPRDVLAQLRGDGNASRA